MNKNTLVIVLVLVVAFGAWYFMTQYEAPAPTADTEQEETEDTNDESADQGDDENGDTTKVITYTSSGYSPSPLTVQAGETVRFVNNSEIDFWPASAMHPTHTVYPGSDILKCATAAAVNIFDACRGIAPGGSWEFTFTQVGEWGYHDHLNAKFFGKVIVE